MNKQILLRYAELKTTITNAEAELDLIKAQALAEVQALRGDTNSPVALTELPGATFSIMKRKTWEYTPATKTLEQTLKDRKKLEEQTGDATFTETEHLLFKTQKDD